MKRTIFITPRQAVCLCQFGECAKAVHMVYNDPILKEAEQQHWLHSGSTLCMRDYLFACFYRAL